MVPSAPRSGVCRVSLPAPCWLLCSLSSPHVAQFISEFRALWGPRTLTPGFRVGLGCLVVGWRLVIAPSTLAVATLCICQLLGVPFACARCSASWFRCLFDLTRAPFVATRLVRSARIAPASSGGVCHSPTLDLSQHFGPVVGVSVSDSMVPHFGGW